MFTKEFKMKKLFILVFILLFLTGCAEGESFIDSLPDGLIEKKPTPIDSETLEIVLEEIERQKNQGYPSYSYEEDKDLVTDAISYTKKIIPLFEYDDYFANKYHEVTIPQINIDTYTVKKLNKEIYDKFYTIVRTLEYDEEGTDYWNITYEYYCHEDILSILIDYTYGWQYGEWQEEYFIYHYDIENDRVLSYTDYLDALGVSRLELTKQINARNTDTLPFSMTVPTLEREGKNSIADVYFDQNKTYISYTYEHQTYIFNCENILDDVSVY